MKKRIDLEPKCVDLCMVILQRLVLVKKPVEFKVVVKYIVNNEQIKQFCRREKPLISAIDIFSCFLFRSLG